MASKEINRPCISITQGRHTLICFSASAKDMWNVLEISKRETDKDKGYQRVLSTARVEAISRYIEKGNIIPNGILISLDRKSKLSKDGKKLTIPIKKNAGWIIDGQHRLAGAKESKNDIELVFIAFIGLDTDQQIFQFVTINREAKGVPTSLYYDLLKHLPSNKNDADWAKERAVDIKNKLTEDVDSPFYKRIVITSPQKGEMSLTNFVRKIAPLVKVKGRFNLYSLEEQTGIINNFFKGLKHQFPDEFRESKNTFVKTLGFGAAVNVLPTVFELSLKHYKAFKIEDVIAILKHIDYFDFSKWDEFGTGSQAEIQAGEDLRAEILKMVENIDNPSTLSL